MDVEAILSELLPQIPDNVFSRWLYDRVSLTWLEDDDDRVDGAPRANSGGLSCVTIKEKATPRRKTSSSSGGNAGIVHMFILC